MSKRKVEIDVPSLRRRIMRQLETDRNRMGINTISNRLALWHGYVQPVLDQLIAEGLALEFKIKDDHGKIRKLYTAAPKDLSYYTETWKKWGGYEAIRA